MNKLALLLAAGLFLGLISIANAARAPDYARDLYRRYTGFEDRIRMQIEKAYHNEEITREEYQDLRAQLINFDNHLRRALRDGRISWVDKRHLETQQEELMGSLREALINGEYYPYPEPHNY